MARKTIAALALLSGVLLVGSGIAAVKAHAYTCTTYCSYNSCTTNCF